MDRSDLISLAERESETRKPLRVHCCTASGCQATGSLELKKALDQAVAARRLGERVEVVGVGCLGLCGRGPLVGLSPSNVLFGKVTPADADSVVGATVGETP